MAPAQRRPSLREPGGALEQLGEERGAAFRQARHDDIVPGARNQGVLCLMALQWRHRRVGPVHGEDGQCRVIGSHHPGRRMRHEAHVGQRRRRKRRQGLRAEDRKVGGMIGIQPGALKVRHIGQPGHVSGVCISADKGGKVPAVLEQ